MNGWIGGLADWFVAVEGGGGMMLLWELFGSSDSHCSSTYGECLPISHFFRDVVSRRNSGRRGSLPIPVDHEFKEGFRVANPEEGCRKQR